MVIKIKNKNNGEKRKERRKGLEKKDEGLLWRRNCLVCCFCVQMIDKKKIDGGRHEFEENRKMEINKRIKITKWCNGERVIEV